MTRSLRVALCVLASWFALAGGARAETIKVGLLKTVGAGPIFIAQEKGYFAAEGLTIEDVIFDSAEPIAVAAVSGAVDIGATGLTAGFYTLAGQGALKMISSGSFERPGFQGQAVLVSTPPGRAASKPLPIGRAIRSRSAKSAARRITASACSRKNSASIPRPCASCRCNRMPTASPR